MSNTGAISPSTIVSDSAIGDIAWSNPSNASASDNSYSTSAIISGGFITEWTVSGDATARTITLPLIESRTEGALSYDCVVDWGDGSATSTVTAFNDGDRIHTYAEDGTYEVEITGTCDGWSFNNAGDKLKITDIIYWGDSSQFNGFTYLRGGFDGCTNLASLGAGKILGRGDGIGAQGFRRTFANCTSITSIPTDLFKNHTAVTSDAFYITFGGCSSLTSIPTDLFRYNTLTSTSAFYGVFTQCSTITTIPTDLFRYNTAVSTSGFFAAFQSCTSLTTVPTDTFRYNTSVSTAGFQQLFAYCSALTSIPTDLFRYNTAVSNLAFAYTFYECTNLATVPENLFKYNTSAVTEAFYGTFAVCNKLQLNAWIFYASGDESTRFLNQSVNFGSCFERDSFTGSQGVAPALWDCTFGTGTPIPSDCYQGAGNSLTSLSNYGDIPVEWV